MKPIPAASFILIVTLALAIMVSFLLIYQNREYRIEMIEVMDLNDSLTAENVRLASQLDSLSESQFTSGIVR
ncbi:MAG: hypothetical protein K0Q66_612 [Chitinophagaceae bacterium]|jgi:hypothetical protein|nr:hypothetical protein [Chitinophagaceae bacterium]